MTTERHTMTLRRLLATLAALWAALLFAPGATAQTTLAVQADGWESLWIPRGNSGVWDAVWRRGGEQVVTVMEGTVRGGQVALRRLSSSDGVLCEYRGSIGPDGLASGTQSCPGHANLAWTGEVQGRAPGGGLAEAFGSSTSLSVEADGWRSVWRQRGRSNTWDAVWVNGDQRVTTVMQGTVRPDLIDLRRTSSSDGVMCSYRGRLGPDRRTISGVQSCPGHPDSAWTGQFGDAGVGGGGFAGGAGPETGLRMWVQTLGLGEADRGAGRAREFLVDPARCTVRELGSAGEPGRRAAQVTLCQPNRRMAFSLAGRGGSIEHDWVFQDGGRQAAGVWRDASGSGLALVSSRP